MKRYIDADKYKKDLIQLGFLPALVVRVLEKQPTADVAPITDTVRTIKDRILTALAYHSTVGVGFIETLLEDIEEEMLGAER